MIMSGEDNKFAHLTIPEAKLARQNNLVVLREHLDDFGQLWSMALSSTPLDHNKATLDTLMYWLNNTGDKVNNMVLLAMVLEAGIEDGIAELAEEIT
jgi:hypothetical protein